MVLLQSIIYELKVNKIQVLIYLSLERLSFANESVHGLYSSIWRFG